MRREWIRGGVALCVLLLSAAVAVPSLRAASPSWLEAPVWFHVVTRKGEPVADEAFLDRQLSMANRIFAPHAIRFVRVGRSAAPGRHAALVSRKDRDVLAEHVRAGVIDVFVVARLMDVDEPGRERRGVHWRPRHAPHKRLVIVSAISMDDVLAHELGHFLGNRRHSDTPGNLMSYKRTEGLPFLAPPQVARARGTLEHMLAEGKLAAPEPEKPASLRPKAGPSAEAQPQQAPAAGG